MKNQCSEVGHIADVGYNNNERAECGQLESFVCVDNFNTVTLFCKLTWERELTIISLQRCVLLIALFTLSAPVNAKTITLSCPSNGAPWVYSIDLDANRVSATVGGALVVPPSSATVTDNTVTFFYEADLGRNGTCQIRNVIDRHSAGITRAPTDSRSECSSYYSSAQCTVITDRSF